MRALPHLPLLAQLVAGVGHGSQCGCNHPKRCDQLLQATVLLSPRDRTQFTAGTGQILQRGPHARIVRVGIKRGGGQSRDLAAIHPRDGG